MKHSVFVIVLMGVLGMAPIDRSSKYPLVAFMVIMAAYYGTHKLK